MLGIISLSSSIVRSIDIAAIGGVSRHARCDHHGPCLSFAAVRECVVAHLGNQRYSSLVLALANSGCSGTREHKYGYVNELVAETVEFALFVRSK